MTRKPRGGVRMNTELLIIAHTDIATTCRQLRTLRRTRGLPQAAIAGPLGVDIATLSSWENCHKAPLAPNLYAWAALLDATIGILPEQEQQ